jgi:glyoxylase-like metal-dependent hydrolase (beta-lactamase superfamily II)
MNVFPIGRGPLGAGRANITNPRWMPPFVPSAGGRVVGEAVADGVGRIPGFVNSYTVRRGTTILLIDTTFSRRAKPLVRAFHAAGVPLEEVNRVLLTHHHVDHMGGAACLAEATHAPVACHGGDVEYVDGRRKQPMPLLMRLLVRVHPVSVSSILSDGDKVDGLSVLHVPGHTPGEIALYDAERRILYSGDSVVEHRGRLTLPGRRFASNLVQAVHSLGRLRSLDIELLLPGHGEPVSRDVAGLLDDLIRRAPGEFLHQLPA